MAGVNLQSVAEWRELLGWLDRVLLETDALLPVEARTFSPDQHARATLGRPGAAPAAIEAAQKRLGAVFPPSYRAFLEASDGMDAMGFWGLPGRLWGTTEVAWLREQDPELIEIWTDGNDDMAPMQNALAVSESGDACLIFLCPDWRTDGSEWECWKHASWVPGEIRYASFGEWLLGNEWRAAYDAWRVAKRNERLRAVPIPAPLTLWTEEALRFWVLGVGCELLPVEAAQRWGKTALPNVDTDAPEFFARFNFENVTDTGFTRLPNPRGQSANTGKVLTALLAAMQQAVRDEPDEADCLLFWLSHLDYRLLSHALTERIAAWERKNEKAPPRDLPAFWRAQDEKRAFCRTLANGLRVLNGQLNA